VLCENARVRVLEYSDDPGHRTTPHRHPDSVMVTLSSFRRRLVADGRQVDVDIPGGVARRLSAQEHSGEDIGATATHTVFVELEEPAPGPVGPTALGPS
jgi:hypothetical protein